MHITPSLKNAKDLFFAYKSGVWGIPSTDFEELTN